jgi:hypothetical protein
MRALNSRDALAGLFFMLVGAIALFVARNYRIGSTSNMGPGYFPVLLSGGLVVLGAILTVKAVLRAAEPDFEMPRWRPLASVIVGIVVFGFLLERAGLVIAIAALIGCAAFGNPTFRKIELLVLIAAMAIFASLVFVLGLGLPIRILPI